MELLFLTIIICTATAAAATSQNKDKFTEELFIRQTPTGHIYNHLRFITLWDTDLRDGEGKQHFDLFPRTLGDILTAFNVQELKLSLTQGIWRTEKWGYPIESAPPGALLIARFLPTTEDVDANWTGLSSSLAGLLCASLNKLDKHESIEPVYAFQHEGISGEGFSTNSSLLRYGILPRENLCTENLTPWKKLLPCKSKRGLATLLNSGHLQRFSTYQSVALQIRPVCLDEACSRPGVELKQSISIIMDPVLFNKKADKIDWSLKQMFGIGVAPACPLADTSAIFIDVTDAGYTLEPAPQRHLDFGAGGHTRRIGVYNVATFAEEGIKNIYARYAKPHIYGIVKSPPVQISRHVVGTGQERGGIVTTIRNRCTSTLTGVYLDLLPWYLRVYLHTLRVEVNGQTVAPMKVVYRPGRDREQPYHLELVLRIPPRSTLVLRLETEYSVLRWTEYPPDANHGFYIGSAAFTTRLPRDSLSNATFTGRRDGSLSHLFWGNPEPDTVLTLFTESLLVTMPTPDFSMPYNVICLACTVAALAFGPLYNITTKQLVLVPPEEEEKSLLGKLLAPMLNFVYAFLGKWKKTPVGEADSKESDTNQDMESDQDKDTTEKKND